MRNYSLHVFHAHQATASAVHYCAHADQVLNAIPTLLDQHPDCSRVDVYAASALLFSVDCQGNRLATR